MQEAKRKRNLRLLKINFGIMFCLILLDTATTIYALGNHSDTFYETMPVAAKFIESFGLVEGLIALTILGSIVIIGGYFNISRQFKTGLILPEAAYVVIFAVLYGVTIIKAAVVANNFYLILSL